MNTKTIAGALFGTLALASLAVAPPAHAASPAITVSAPQNTPYSTITITGSGFAANETVHVLLGLSNADVPADAAGSFTATLTIPNVPAGLYLVIAIGQTSGLPAFSYLWVNALLPQAAPSTWWATPGSTITFSGSGFAPNEAITVMHDGTAIASTTVDASGSFTNAAPFVIPFSWRNSSATLTVQGASSGGSITFTIGVANLYPYALPSTWYAKPSTPVAFSGGGFGPNETVNIFVGAGTTSIASFPADATGAFAGAGATTLPFGASPVTYRLVGAQSGAEADAPVTLAPFYVTVNPSLWYVNPGTSISLTGAGFAANEGVDISFGSATTTATADADGNFTVPSLLVPPAPGTTVPLTATGALSGGTETIYITVAKLYPWLNLSTYWAQGGTPLTVTGAGFLPNEPITLTSGSTTLATGSANPDGSLNIATQVPFVPPGAATITAQGGTSGGTASVGMTVAQVYTDLQLAQYYGAPGDSITFLGHGYLPNEPIEVTTDRTGSTVVHTFTADAGGNFSDSGYVIPGDFAEGNLVVTVTGTHSFDQKSITFYVTGH